MVEEKVRTKLKGKKFAVDVSWVLISSIVSLAIGFALRVVLARYFGPSKLGTYSMVITIYSIVAVFGAIGIYEAIIRYVAMYKDDKDKLSSFAYSGTVNALLFGGMVTILIFFSSDFFAKIFSMPELSYLLKIIALIFPFFILNSTLIGFLNGLRKAKTMAFATLLRRGIIFPLTVMLILIGWGLRGAAIALVLSAMITSFFLILKLRRYIFSTRGYGYINATKELLGLGVKEVGSQSIGLLNTYTDTLMIGYFWTSQQLGFYSIALLAHTILWFIPSAINRIYYPTVSNYYAKKDVKAIVYATKICVKYSSVLLLIMGMPAILFGRELISIVFGYNYLPALTALKIMVIGAILIGVGRSIGTLLWATGNATLSVKITGISALLNVTLNALLIPIYGISGGALATSISLSISSLLIVYFIKKAINVNVFKEYYKTMIFMALMIPLVVFDLLTSNFILNCAILGIFSSAVIVFMLTKEDRRHITSVVKSYF